MTNFKKTLLGAVCASMFVAAPAGAATSSVGSAAVPDLVCGMNTVHWNTSAPYVVGSVGTITQLSTFIGSGTFPASYSLKVLRPSTNQIIGTTPTLVATGIGSVSAAVSVPVQPGDVLGIWIGPAAFDCIKIGGVSDFGFTSPSVADPGPGAIPGAPSSFGSRRYSVAATLVTPDPPPPPPPAPPACKVPALKGKTKSAAKSTLEKANCKLGTTKKKKLKKFTKKQKKNRVRSQSVKAGSIKPHGTIVNITINVKK